MISLSTALRPDLHAIKKSIYFHENQFEYPVREEIERDGQFGWTQALSASVADVVFWNSNYNLQSFLSGLRKFIMTMPKEQRPTYDTMAKRITEKSVISYFPVPPVPLDITPLSAPTDDRPLHIVWNHRWEWDKGPEIFFSALRKVIEGFQIAQTSTSSTAFPQATSESSMAVTAQETSIPTFYVSVIGESFGEVPEEFEKAKTEFAPYLKHFGYLESRGLYFNALNEADIVVSTALHEFFGVSVIEAIRCGCYPLCPNRLVFPEYLPEAHLYKTEEQLAKKLRYFIKYPQKLRQMSDWKKEIKISRFSWEAFESTLQSSGMLG